MAKRRTDKVYYDIVRSSIPSNVRAFACQVMNKAYIPSSPTPNSSDETTRVHDQNSDPDSDQMESDIIARFHSITQELMESRSREVDKDSLINDLQERVHELEMANRRLKESPPDHNFAALQEELISVKMREAEATLSLKEMRHKMNQLDSEWKKYSTRPSAICRRCGGPTSESLNSPNATSISSDSIDSQNHLPAAKSESSHVNQETINHSPYDHPVLNSTESPLTPSSVCSEFATVKNDVAVLSSMSEDDSAYLLRRRPKTDIAAGASEGLSKAVKRRSAIIGNLLKSSSEAVIWRISEHLPAPPRGDPSLSCENWSSPEAGKQKWEEQLMGSRIREAEASCELREMKQRVMELETQNHVCSNQIRRQDEECKRLQAELDSALSCQQEADFKLRDALRRLGDKESQMLEVCMMGRLKETELLQQTAELKNKLSEMESKQCFRWAQDQFNNGIKIPTPTSMFNSTNSIDALSTVSSEFDMAQLSLKVPHNVATLPNSLNSSSLNNSLVNMHKLQLCSDVSFENKKRPNSGGIGENDYGSDSPAAPKSSITPTSLPGDLLMKENLIESLSIEEFSLPSNENSKWRRNNKENLQSISPELLSDLLLEHIGSDGCEGDSDTTIGGGPLERTSVKPAVSPDSAYTTGRKLSSDSFGLFIESGYETGNP